MSAHVRLIAEMIAALVVAGIFLRELYSRPMIESTRMWPLVVLVLMIVVAGAQLLTAACRRLSGDSTTQAATSPQEEWPYPGRRYALMAAFVAYLLALPHLGYALASAAFIPIAGLILAMPLTVRNVASGVVMAVGAYLLFVVAFEVPMPVGPLPHPRQWF